MSNLGNNAALNYECLAFAAEKSEKQLQGKESKEKERKEMVLESAKLALAKLEMSRLLWRKIKYKWHPFMYCRICTIYLLLSQFSNVHQIINNFVCSEGGG
jgi:hypothetical protein